MKQAFVTKNFRADALDIIAKADRICTDYARQGYDLTLRQLYYQFVSRDWIANKQTEYKRLGDIISDGRLAGLIDWDHITDRGRNLLSLSHWDSPSSIVSTCARQFRYDSWEGQPNYVEVWVEKQALESVIGRAAEAWDVPYIACKGYMSISEMHAAAIRFRSKLTKDESFKRRDGHIIHLGDHDPSGMDMTRDIEDRLSLFGARVEVHRIALNMDQVEQYNPPPNPAKLTDSRCEAYMERFGEESWELDALEPSVLDTLIQDWIKRLCDVPLREERLYQQGKARAVLQAVADNWSDVEETYADVEPDMAEDYPGYPEDDDE